jgi:hypothetical protein
MAESVEEDFDVPHRREHPSAVAFDNILDEVDDAELAALVIDGR